MSKIGKRWHSAACPDLPAWVLSSPLLRPCSCLPAELFKRLYGREEQEDDCVPDGKSWITGLTYGATIWLGHTRTHTHGSLPYGITARAHTHTHMWFYFGQSCYAGCSAQLLLRLLPLSCSSSALLVVWIHSLSEHLHDVWAWTSHVSAPSFLFMDIGYLCSQMHPFVL